MDQLRDIWFARRKELIFAGFIALAAALSFGLGYLAAGSRSAPIIIEQCLGIDGNTSAP